MFRKRIFDRILHLSASLGSENLGMPLRVLELNGARKKEIVLRSQEIQAVAQTMRSITPEAPSQDFRFRCNQ